jgi:hypothetical protein
LQNGSGAEQLPGLAERLGIVDFGAELDASTPFADTAAIVSCVDLVITVDTALAHIAGALGVPVWLALSLVVDWRWQLEREDTPWYPTMRLFRQRRQGEWEPVFTRMAGELRRLVEKKASRSKNSAS